MSSDTTENTATVREVEPSTRQPDVPSGHQKDHLLRMEREYWQRGFSWIAGVDEAGRGPLAGPVVAAAVVFPPERFIEGVKDSKLLAADARDELYERIIAEAATVGVGIVHHDVIDQINILQATFRAMHEAIRRLAFTPSLLLVDGNRFLDNGIPYRTIVDGDALSFSIAAASIVAKVTRDRLMLEYDAQFPGYGFGQHKGYATPQHREAIRRLGLCPIHRRSFTVRPQQEFEFST